MNQTGVPNPQTDGRAYCRVTYRMTDQMGVVYYGNYLELFEMGRVELMRSRGIRYLDMESEGYLLPVTHAACTYVAPARYDDLLQITTRIEKITRVRVNFAYEIALSGEDKLLATGTTHHAIVSREGRPRRLSHEWFDALKIMAEAPEAD